jgi:hypothetical protein
MSGYEITCANRDQNGMIIRIGGEGWSLSVQDAITKLVSQQLRVFVRAENTFTDVGVRGEGSNAYLALEPDGYPLHNLSELPSC